MKITNDFIIGAATAAYQVEGAVAEDDRIPIYWDREFHQNNSRFNADIASDFYHKYEEDIKNAQEFNIKAIRISIAWSRIILNEKNEINEKGLDFYDKLINCCLEHNVEPYVTLHHFDTPLIFFDKGDWLNKDNIDNFLAFANVCFKRFGDRVKHWITINEPWSVVCGQYIIGHFPPHIKYDIEKAVVAMNNLMIAHSKCVIMYKEMNLDGEIGIVHILESKYPFDKTLQSAIAAKRENTLANNFLLEATFNGDYSNETLNQINEILKLNNKHFKITNEEKEILLQGAKLNDFLGLNYYSSHFIAPWNGESYIHHNGSGEKGTSCFRLKGIGERLTKPNIKTTSWDWPIYPQGLEDMLLKISNKYGDIKVYITENGMGALESLENNTVNDDDRIEYIKEHLNAIFKAKEKGVNVKGYFIWSLFDLFSWTNGYNKRYGLFYTDFETQKRYPKKSAYWIKGLIDEK